MLLPIFIILMVLAPVLVPAVITAAHHLTGRARTSTQDARPRHTVRPG
jgi:hypothetical protein